MANREKVIRGLELCAYDPDPGQELKEIRSCPECPYYRAGCSPQLIRDALALLKDQEPRVMTWDELMRCADGDPVFIEASDRNGCWVLIYPTYMGINGKNGYGVRWRYWTSRPSPEQMRDTKWEADNEIV